MNVYTLFALLIVATICSAGINEPSTTPLPVTDPPVTDPPVTDPPVTNPPVTNPPTVTPRPTAPPGETLCPQCKCMAGNGNCINVCSKATERRCCLTDKLNLCGTCAVTLGQSWCRPF